MGYASKNSVQLGFGLNHVLHMLQAFKKKTSGDGRHDGAL